MAAPLLVLLVTALTYLPALGNRFVDRDDPQLVVENPAFHRLGWAAVRYAWTTENMGHWAPLTWLSWSLDYAVWGLRPFGFHLTNLVLHLVAVLLLYLLARRLGALAGLTGTGLTTGAAVAAGFFGVHPLRAETVAWVTERRGVLSGALFLASVLAWLEATTPPGARRRRWLAVSVAAFALAFLSKSSTMVLPLALVILDVYPVRRLPPDPRHWTDPAYRRVWVEKVPYLAVALLGGVVAFLVQEAGSPNRSASLVERAANVGFTLWFHAVKQALPVNLSPLHEWPDGLDPRAGRFLVAGVGVAVLTLLALALRRRWPAGLAGWAYHVVALLPVLGVFPLGDQLTAERYSYLPSLGWALLAGGGVGAAAAAGRRGQVSRGVLGTFLVVVAGWLGWLAVLGSAQARVWHDSASLWRQAAAADPACWRCRQAWGDLLRSEDRAPEAEREYRAALALNPAASDVLHALGLALAEQGRHAEAVEQYRLAAQRGPRRLGRAIDLAAALRALGRLDEAVATVREAVGGVGPERARDALPAALDSPATAAVARLGLLEAYRRLGQQAEARAAAEALAWLDADLAQAASP